MTQDQFHKIALAMVRDSLNKQVRMLKREAAKRRLGDRRERHIRRWTRVIDLFVGFGMLVFLAHAIVRFHL